MPNKRGQPALIIQGLAIERMQDVLRRCEDGPVRPKRLAELLPDVGHWQLHHCLDLGVATGILRRVRTRSLPPEAGYQLAQTWPHVEFAYAAALACEEASRMVEDLCGGLFALRTAAHPLWVPIVAALADGPLEYHEVGDTLGGTTTTLWEQLQRLSTAGLLERTQGPSGKELYAASDTARRLAIVPVACVSMEWSLGHVVDPVYGSNLHDLVHALAPLAEVSSDVGGDCQLHVDCPQCLRPDVHVRIENGRLVPLQSPPGRSPSAIAHATPAQWCHALLRDCPAATHCAGHGPLLDAAVSALSAALVPETLAIRLRQA